MMFVIQSLPRSGTHMLKTLVDSHTAIDCFGEVLNPDNTGHGFHKLRPSPKEIVDYCNKQNRLTGFIVHSHGGLEEKDVTPAIEKLYETNSYVKQAKGIWKLIPKETPVITLWRNNLLKRYISELVAAKSGLWQVYGKHRKINLTKVHVDCKKMLMDFAQTLALIGISKKRFEKACFITYEDLTENFKDTSIKLQKYLNVSIQDIEPNTTKVGKPLVDTIVNYNEVVACIKNNGYSRFLEEHHARL